MARLNVLVYPDECLKIIAKPVVEVNDEIREIVDNMFETMYLEEGIALAATQVNIHQRIITIVEEGTKEQQYVLINPEISDSCGETGFEEGWLSLPGF
ncbi:peptide deformylase, partial [Pasteurella multocida]|uniref:peptide deformylase n=1 Tax=Pasteurella multocida TaxID=747 RepID=UPI0017D5E03E